MNVLLIYLIENCFVVKKKNVYNEDFVNFVLNIFLVCKWKLINSVKYNFY